MDTIPIIASWPKHPYRGLDFYREADALLFRERDKDVRECAAILVGFGVKILLLQGSSGSGKSSFLRAGLIPHLKRSDRRHFFLSGRDSVIRCTSDPLREIAQTLVDALRGGGIAGEPASRGSEWGGETLAAADVGARVCSGIEQALSGPRERLAEHLVEALVEICGDLPGKLILVLDQAEEVLTHTSSGRVADEAGAAFFRFLEGVYLRNVDMRLVVALRTEYYGRFRDELRISDDRLGKRPRSGGVEPYLLRSLREKAALAGIVDAPTLARSENGSAVYDFAFEQGLADRIVDDLLEMFPYASVTPALQVVCASLHERLTDKNRIITQAEYVKRGRIIGIVDEYLTRGVAAAGARTKAQRDQWGELLHSLVSRQGGGTLVSLIEPVEELEKKARELGVDGAVGPALIKMTGGATPLLRGEPPEDPRNFSLKHDVLAVVLVRWHAEHAGAVKAKKEVKRLLLAGGLVILAIGLLLGSVIWQRADEAFRAKARGVHLTNRHAVQAPEGNFRQSILLTLANLDGTKRSGDFLEWVTGDNTRIHAETVAELRKVLSRAPWFAGRYRAAGLDPAGGRIALLAPDQRELLVLAFPPSGAEAEAPQPRAYGLPAQKAQDSPLRPAAGFVAGLGPVALVDGRAFFWSGHGARQECDVGHGLPPSMASGSWFRTEFVGGRLQISTTERHDLTMGLRVLALDAAQLSACSGAIRTAAVRQVPERPFSQPVPVFSDAPDLPQSYAYLEETAKPAPNELSANLPVDPSRSGTGQPVELDAVVSLPERQGQPVHTPVGQVSAERGVPERLHYTIASAVNAPAMLFKFDGPDFYVYDLAKGHPSSRPGYFDVTPQRVAGSSTLPPAAWRLQSARIPWVYPPFAAAKIGQHWRAAWLAANGVWAVESSDLDPGTTRPILDDPLMGEPDGAKLQFTRDGQFLVLQRVQLQLPVSVRIWQLRSSWRSWIADPKTTEQDLRRVACRIARMDGTGAFDETEMELFQIDPEQREPCPEAKGAGS